MDDPPPPPPYSEIDPGDSYSHAGASSHPINTPATSSVDTVSVAGRLLPSTASSGDETVYTPLYSPTEPVHQSQLLPDGDASSASATAYFESRPSHGSLTGSQEPYSINITPTTEARDIPYPLTFLGRDITRQDWASFVNHILPHHTAGINTEVVDRKLKAELINDPMRRLTLGQEDTSRTDLRAVYAQLEPLRQSQTQQSSDEARRIQETVSQWNHGFFQPRGVVIMATSSEAEDNSLAGEMSTKPLPGEVSQPVPGSWPPLEQELVTEPSSSDASGRRGLFGGFMQASRYGFRLGNIVADNNGFRIGRNGVKADNSGFRLGNMLVSDRNGLRLGGSRGSNAGRDKGYSFGGKLSGCGEHEILERGIGERGHRRGRSYSRGRHRRRRDRSASTSSSFSSSSSSSSDSDSSIGSLPQYEGIKDTQLSAAKISLLEWLNRPEQPITRDTVRSIKRDIKSATKDVHKRSEKDEDLRSLRADIRALMKQFKDRKRTEKRERRELNRERRAARRDLRSERRSSRRERRKSTKLDSWSSPKEASMPMLSNLPSVPMTPMPAIPVHSNSMPMFPFKRTGGLPFQGPFGKGEHGSPGMSAMHGGWPFAHHQRYVPSISVSSGRAQMWQGPGFPAPVTYTAEYIHAQALQFENIAKQNETDAIELRARATVNDMGEKDRLKILGEATELEEEADKHIRESERLRADLRHLDAELARGLEEEEGPSK